VIGVYAISAAFVGWLHGPAGPLRRVLIGLSGVALLLPPGLGGVHTLWINGAGLIALAGLWVLGRRDHAIPTVVAAGSDLG
jgi:hypothetical protein